MLLDIVLDPSAGHSRRITRRKCEGTRQQQPSQREKFHPLLLQREPVCLPKYSSALKSVCRRWRHMDKYSRQSRVSTASAYFRTRNQQQVRGVIEESRIAAEAVLQHAQGMNKVGVGRRLRGIPVRISREAVVE
jgi:hypothetical protein